MDEGVTGRCDWKVPMAGYGGCEWKELTRFELRVVEGINGGVSGGCR